MLDSLAGSFLDVSILGNVAIPIAAPIPAEAGVIGRHILAEQ